MFDLYANGRQKIIALADMADAPTGVEELQAEGKARIYGKEGAVVVTGADDTVLIYNMMGLLVKSAKVEDGAAVVELPAGYYIVRAGRSAAKVIVK